ncbi:hypothetical protein IMSAGC019_03029 [Lachnospiraceae bacterium]|nr:hypothetical protein IMSAGC019_03029 [Lachnospiraceae bacterium]
MIYIHIENIVFFDDNRRAFRFFRIFSQNLCTFFSLIDKNHRNPWLYDPCLFPGNFPDTAAQVLHMVKPDFRDHAEGRFFYTVGGVQPAPHACFQYKIIWLLFCKIPHCHKKKEFKKGWMPLALSFFFHGCLPDLPVYLQEPFFRNDFPAYGNPLPHTFQVGRGKHAHPAPAFRQQGTQISTNGTFSVCACYVNYFAFYASACYFPQQPFCICQRMLSCKPGDAENIAFRLFISFSHLPRISQILSGMPRSLSLRILILGS